MSVLDDQRLYVEAALRDAELLPRAYSVHGCAAQRIVENLREVVRLYGENGEFIPTMSCEVRQEDRPCRTCDGGIQAGQIYLPDGPYHVGCVPRSQRIGPR